GTRGSLDGPVHVIAIGLVDVAECLAGGRVDGREGLAGRAADELAVDEQELVLDGGAFDSAGIGECCGGHGASWCSRERDSRGGRHPAPRRETSASPILTARGPEGKSRGRTARHTPVHQRKSSPPTSAPSASGRGSPRHFRSK